MNGIFGICEAGFPLNVDALQPALDAQGASNRSVCDLSGGQSFAFGADGTGAQIATVDGVTVVVDADLLGLRELARVQLGVSDFASELSPAQILAKLYLRHGSDFLSSLHGAFALALWDQHESRFLLAIDRMGIKSLYWRREGQRILFGSKLRAVRALQSAPVEVNPKAVLQFLVFSMVPASTSIDQGTNKLRPDVKYPFTAIEWPNTGIGISNIRRARIQTLITGRRGCTTNCAAPFIAIWKGAMPIPQGVI